MAPLVESAPDHEVQPFTGFTVNVPPPVEDGTYSASLVSFEAWDWTSPDGDLVPLLTWHFDVEVGDAVVDISGVSGRPLPGEKVHVKSKAVAWLTGLVGAANIHNDVAFDPPTLIGKRCLVSVGPRKKDGEPEVQNVMALPKGSAEPVAAKCEGFDTQFGACQREKGHTGNHQASTQETWA